jgi:hypothetical protein
MLFEGRGARVSQTGGRNRADRRGQSEHEQRADRHESPVSRMGKEVFEREGHQNHHDRRAESRRRSGHHEGGDPSHERNCFVRK